MARSSLDKALERARGYAILFNKFFGMTKLTSRRLFYAYIYPHKLIVILLFSFIFMFFRNTDLLLQPQLWGEDGSQFYADAYQNGVDSLFWTYAGFYQTLLRIGGLLATFISIEYVPLFFSIVSYLCMLLPVFILWSDENLLFGKGRNRKVLILTIIYLLLPMHWETLGNLTNIGWYLAISAALVLLREKKDAKKWRFFDCGILIASGLTGPYALLLVLPALYIRLTSSKDRIATIKLVIIILCAFLQVIAMIGSPIQKEETTRSQVKTVIKEYKRPFQVTGMRFVIEPAMQSKNLQQEVASSDQVYLLGAVIIIMWVAFFILAPQKLKAIGFFGFSSYIVMMFRVSGDTRLVNHWDTMQISNLGARYLLIPLFCWVIVLLHYAYKSKGIFKHLSITLLALLLITLPLSYQLKRVDYKFFETQARQFKALRSGEYFCFQENPDGWEMCLTKK